MGNTAAKCSDGAKGYQMIPPAPPMTAATPSIEVEVEKQTKDGVCNPGDYEDLGKGVKEHVMPHTFDGCKIIINKGLSRHFQTAHTLTLGATTQPTQWQFGATYVGTQQIGENEFHPVLMGDISTNGNFTALYVHQLAKAWRLKLNMQTQGQRWVGYQGSLDYRGSDFTFTSTLANPDLFTASGVAVFQYLQSWTPRLSVGTELLYQKGSGIEASLLSLGGTYNGGGWDVAAKVGLHAWNVTYHHKYKGVQLATEFDGNLMQGETTAAIGYKADIGSSFTIRSKLDSHGTVATVIEKRLEPLPATLTLSGQLNHWTDDCKFGLGLTVG
ncbi:hypothetical protein EMCRGX_G011077 [Ephydatia muelleri]|eukprot:Em0006g1235a